LENIITRACVLNEGQAITADQLRPWLEQPDRVGAAEAALPVGSRLEDLERQMILATLEHYEGHRAKAAQALGIGVRTLSGKLRNYGIAPHARDFSDGLAESRQNPPIPAASSAGGATRRTA
jgi:DNA-binding NtrC family response regulator